MIEIAITFTPDGIGHALYTEAIDLSGIGPLHIKRVTTIEFVKKTQYWIVKDRKGFAMFHSPSRQECLDWERQYVQAQEDLKHELQHGAGAVAVGMRGGHRQDQVAGGRVPHMCGHSKPGTGIVSRPVS
jgi:hypothetical protein